MELLPTPRQLSPEQINHYYAAGYWRTQTVEDLLEKQAVERSADVAIVDGDQRVTWLELYRLSRRLAHHLVELGIACGDAVALLLPNWLEYVICYYGIQLAGALVVQPGIDWRNVELEHALKVGPAKAMIIPREFRIDFPSMIREIQPRLPHLGHVIVARGEAPEGCISLDRLLEHAGAAEDESNDRETRSPISEGVDRIVFTSGTTGLPKAVMHTNRTLDYSSWALTSDFGFDANDVIFMYLPFSTNYGTIVGLHLPLTVGATIVLMDRFAPDRAVQLIGREGVTFVPGTPTAFLALINSEQARDPAFRSVRLTFTAGASAPPDLLPRMRATFGSTAVEGFGMNEFGVAFWFLPTDDSAIVDGSIGRPIKGVEARIVDTDGRDVTAGQMGEMIIKSPGMCLGYWPATDGDSGAWDRDGWFHSGDLMTKDEHGNFRVVGRSKDIIIRGGANVSPPEIENSLAEHPKVRDVAVVGLPDAKYGEVVCACVIPHDGQSVTLEEIRQFLEPRIAFFKLPTHLILCKEFPTNSLGKVQRVILRKKIMQSKE